MRNCFTPHQTAPAMPENSAKQNNTLDSPSKSELKINELEIELRRQKAAAEKGAKLMQIIWGDKFQSDSLH